jgi:NAD(P)-dependent dehydrogenase (short-subunit alcohol dehydrogenase family)
MLTDKKIIVTGAAMGLGKVFAEAILNAHARIVIMDIQENMLHITHQELMAKGFTPDQVQYVVADMGNPDSIKSGIAEAAQKLGGIDGLINNAAIATNVGGKLMEDVDIDLWDRVQRVNVRGVWLTSVACLPFLKQSIHGKIINIASDTAIWGAPKLMAYVASKGAVLSMTKSMARELGAFNICVNVIAPGLVRSESTEYVPKERHDFYENGRAISRPQYPEDLTGTALYLLSDHSNFVTGQTLIVNGGFVLA